MEMEGKIQRNLKSKNIEDVVRLRNSREKIKIDDRWRVLKIEIQNWKFGNSKKFQNWRQSEIIEDDWKLMNKYGKELRCTFNLGKLDIENWRIEWNKIRESKEVGKLTK